MVTLFPLEVHTPFRLFYSVLVEPIVLTLVDGDAAIYANHVPITAPVVPCLLKIKDKQGNWKTAFIAESLLEVKQHKTVLISDAAEWPEEIDPERAKAAKENAEKALNESLFKFEKITAAASLKRANMRLRVREEGMLPRNASK